jgi:DNA-binding XRE family transcriptional regulator
MPRAWTRFAPASKRCEHCGSIIERRRRDAATTWEARRFCSRVCGSKGTASKRSSPIEARFLARIDKTSSRCGCWEWMGPKNAYGYGILTSGRTARFAAHRFSFVYHKGSDLPDGLEVMHACDNPGCVNPAHLHIGTHADNMADCARKGRARPPRLPGESNPRAKLTYDQVAEIRLIFRSGSATQADLARRFGVSKSAVQFIVSGQHWKQHESYPSLFKDAW